MRCCEGLDEVVNGGFGFEDRGDALFDVLVLACIDLLKDGCSPMHHN